MSFGNEVLKYFDNQLEGSFCFWKESCKNGVVKINFIYDDGKKKQLGYLRVYQRLSGVYTKGVFAHRRYGTRFTKGDRKFFSELMWGVLNRINEEYIYF